MYLTKAFSSDDPHDRQGTFSTPNLITVGFNVEKVKFGKVYLEVWDIGGQDKIRPLWRHCKMPDQLRVVRLTRE